MLSAPEGSTRAGHPQAGSGLPVLRSSYDPGAQVISHRLPSGSAKYPE